MEILSRRVHIKYMYEACPLHKTGRQKRENYLRQADRKEKTIFMILMKRDFFYFEGK
jgi:hypothetical protein